MEDRRTVAPHLPGAKLCALMVVIVIGLSGCAGHAAIESRASRSSASSVGDPDVDARFRAASEPIVPTAIRGALQLGSTTITAPPRGFESTLSMDDLTASDPALRRYLQQSAEVHWYVGTLLDESYEPSNDRTVLYAYFPEVTCIPSRPASASLDGHIVATSVPCPSALIFDAGSGAIMREMNGAADPASA